MSFRGVLDEGGMVAIFVDPEINREDLECLGARVQGSNFFVPGFIPGESGTFGLDDLLYARFIEKVDHVILPDRNIVTRIAGIAKSGLGGNADKHAIAAAELMAFAQMLGWGIEPAIAFYELGQRKGNQVAAEELAWFRLAEAIRPRRWADLALGRITTFGTINTPAVEQLHDFAVTIDKWETNYAALLKIAELELSGLSPIEKASEFFTWLFQDFLWAGCAAMFAVLYFSSSYERKGMIKALRSEDRKKALAGIRNAAWDVTYLSDFTARATASDYEKKRFVFATADRNLSHLAGLLFPDINPCKIANELAQIFL